ncbi:MAG: hypothetical protein MUF54_21075 [Polyangiaceae bacterium]|nr:hypothetical protein [Polyangiaceae bacterium]
MLMLILALLAWATGSAHADTPAAHSSFIEVRLGLSRAATDRFPLQRFRRYLAIELDELGHISARADGPLGDNVAYLWIDVPDASTVAIQARLAGRPVGQRTLALREGLRVDVAARLVALAASEMLRSQVSKPRARRPQAPKPPPPALLELRTRDNPAIVVDAEAAGAWVPDGEVVMGGPGIQAGFRFARLDHRLFASWMVGGANAATIRWAEVGVGARYLLWLAPRWRLGMGARAAAASVRVHQAASVDGTQGERDGWTGRAGAEFAVERSLGAPLWLTLSLQPGFVLAPVRYVDGDGDREALQGLWMSAQIGFTFDQRFARESFTRL